MPEFARIQKRREKISPAGRQPRFFQLNANRRIGETRGASPETDARMRALILFGTSCQMRGFTAAIMAGLRNQVMQTTLRR